MEEWHPIGHPNPRISRRGEQPNNGKCQHPAKYSASHTVRVAGRNRRTTGNAHCIGPITRFLDLGILLLIFLLLGYFGRLSLWLDRDDDCRIPRRLSRIPINWQSVSRRMGWPKTEVDGRSGGGLFHVISKWLDGYNYTHGDILVEDFPRGEYRKNRHRPGIRTGVWPLLAAILVGW